MKKLILILLTCNLFGCYDRGYGPSIVNSSSSEKTVIINYESKESLKRTLKKCGGILSGREFDPVESIIVDGLTYDTSSLDKKSDQTIIVQIFDETVLFLNSNRCLAP
ncbi:hypothetical protein ACFFUS_01095 [Vibrio gallaecicus]|uniref:Lipoprotein n=1 Tax=Vibrio gallaecicus TaxID=552386 RepID=A0ABV4N6C7_9VIBR|nr:hypothetical protein [Vibrio gallaecicus]MDN3612991.1 hypothetical protein [Vibrio gallaecicus]